MKKFLAIMGSSLIGLMLATGVYAAVEQVPVEVEYITPVSIAENSTMKFGLLDVAMVAGETLTIAPDSTVTGDTARIVGGVQAAAQLTITATASTPIRIIADNPSNGVYYTLDTWVCKYVASADTACTTGTPFDVTSDASGTGILLVGVKLTAVGVPVVGPDNSTFDVTVVYQ